MKKELLLRIIQWVLVKEKKRKKNVKNEKYCHRKKNDFYEEFKDSKWKKENIFMTKENSRQRKEREKKEEI